jgi:uncharacterized protein (TIGR02145 family)
MKKLIIIAVGFLVFFTSCKKDTNMKVSPAPGDPMTDIDGNVYRTIQIGNQLWMQENLRTTRYADGASITAQTFGYKNSYEDEANYFTDSVNKYGLLYNWVAATRAEQNCQTKVSFSDEKRQGVCPNGWHLPNDKEWKILVDNLGGKRVAGGKMKTVGFDDWKSPNLSATNESQFYATPSGQFFDGFDSLGYYAYYWSSTQKDAFTGGSVYIGYHWDQVDISSAGKTAGLACRCIRD